MARKHVGELSKSYVSKDLIDAWGYVNGYSILGCRAILAALRRPWLFATKPSKKQEKTERVMHPEALWYESLQIIKEQYPADYLFILEKSKDRRRLYMHHATITYLRRLRSRHRYMVHVSTPDTSFDCANKSVAALWIKKTFPTDTEWSNSIGIPLGFPTPDSMTKQIKKHGIAEFYYPGGCVKVGPLGKSEKDGEEA